MKHLPQINYRMYTAKRVVPNVILQSSSYLRSFSSHAGFFPKSENDVWDYLFSLSPREMNTWRDVMPDAFYLHLIRAFHKTRYFLWEYLDQRFSFQSVFSIILLMTAFLLWKDRKDTEPKSLHVISFAIKTVILLLFTRGCYAQILIAAVLTLTEILIPQVFKREAGKKKKGE